MMDPIETRAKQIVMFLDYYRWLSDSYISDFFVLSHWERLPSTWRTCLQKLSPLELAILLDPCCFDKRNVWPLSLLSYKAFVHGYCLAREPIDLNDMQLASWLCSVQPAQDQVKTRVVANEAGTLNSSLMSEIKDGNLASSTLNKIPSTDSFLENGGGNQRSSGDPCTEKTGHGQGGTTQLTSNQGRESCKFKCGQYLELESLYRKHVKPKKQHEIHQLGQVIKRVCEGCHCSNVVDVGAGLGHLSRLMTFDLGLKVTTIEASEDHAPKASKYDKQLQEGIDRQAKKSASRELKEMDVRTNPRPVVLDADINEYLVKEVVPLPSHLVHRINSSISQENFMDVLFRSRQNETISSEKPDQNMYRGFQNLSYQSQRNQNERTFTEKPDQNMYRGFQNLSYQSQRNQNERTFTEKPDQNVERNSENSSCQSQINQNETTSEKVEQKFDGNNQYGVCPCHQQLNCQNAEYCDTDNKIFSTWRRANSSRAEIREENSELPTISSRKPQVHLGNEQSCFPAVQQATPDADAITAKVDGCRRDIPAVAGKEEPVCEEKENFVLCGLHACGDLTSTLLRVFAQCPQAVGLASVGCCYMKLTDRRRLGSEQIGYPMSKFVQELPAHELSYESREMACHSMDCYHQRLKEDRPNLILHCYRAALQQIILDKHPNFQRGATQLTVKKAENMTFERYASTALKRLGLEEGLTGGQLSVAEEHLSRWKDIVAYYTIRLCLAPLVETILLLDRKLYLREQDIDSILVPVFDPSISPRNFVLLAKK